MELILIRHALPVRIENRPGTPADPPLSESGKNQATALAEWFADEPVDRIYSSPLRRALETALPLVQGRELEIEIEPSVAEFDRDSSSYIPLEELKETNYPMWLDFMKRGYPDGQDLEAFRRDVVACLESIARLNPGRRVIVVCHGGVINTWAAHVLGLDFRMFFNPMYTSINRTLVSSGGIRSIGSLNEVAHLRALRFGTSA